MNGDIGHRYLFWMKQATVILVSDCRFGVSPVNYPDMVKLGRVDWVV